MLYDYYVKHMDTPGIARREKYTPGYIRKTKRNAENLLSMLGQDRVNGTLPAWYIKEKGEDDA